MPSCLHVVAVGARTPVGFTARASAAAVRGQIGRFGAHAGLRPRDAPALVTASDSALAPEMPAFERAQAMAISALGEALGQIPALQGTALPMDIVLGLPEPRPGYAAGGHIAISRHLKDAAAEAGFQARVWPLGLGHAAALEGLRQASARIDADPHSLIAIGGADSYLDPESIAWLEHSGRLYDGQADCGLTPGEGAAFVIVTSDLVERTYKLTTLARVRGVHAVQQAPTLGQASQGLLQAIAGATASLHTPGDAIEAVIGDLNGEPHRAEEWAEALHSAEPLLGGARCVTPAAQWGDTGAASGALFLMLATEWFVRRCARGRRALAWAGSDRGLRAAALLEHA